MTAIGGVLKITLLGAANDVTGSCYLVQTGSSRFLVDCGMFQGSERLERLNKIPTSVVPNRIDGVLLTHGHLDHCGRLPLLMKSGYHGPIYATEGTIRIANLILADAAHIQENDTARENRRRERAGLPKLDPLFETKDAERVMRQFRACKLGEPFKIGKDVTVTLRDAGHILGSSSIEIFLENGETKKLVFSGDVGQYNVPIMNDPYEIESADAVFLESTYGDRDHRSFESTVIEFESIVRSAVGKKGKILIPTFAVGRAQTMLYCLAEMFRKNVIPRIPIFLDSPMAIAATRAYVENAESLDEEAAGLITSGTLKRDLASLIACETAEQSQALNAVNGPCVILAGAGMCNAGRILHHLKHNLWNPNCVVVIVGFQSKGSLGRLLIEGSKKVKIFGETVVVNATVKSLGGFSAHAGQSDLLKWFSSMAKSRPRVILTHGESHPMNILTDHIRTKFEIDAESPRLGETVVI